MELKSRCVITGVRRLDFKDDGGKSISMTQVYVEERFSRDSKDGLGSSTVPYAYGDAKKFDEFSGVVFPMQADVELRTVTTGGKQKTELVSVAQVGAPKKAGVV